MESLSTKQFQKFTKICVWMCKIFPITGLNISFKETQREKAPSNKTPALTKSTDLGVWATGTSNELFIRGSSTETKFSKKYSSYWQNSVLCDRSILYSSSDKWSHLAYFL